MKNLLLILFLFSFFLPNGKAQEAQEIQLFYLKDGSFFQGRLLEQVQESGLHKIELTGGSVIEIKESSLLKVTRQKPGWKLLQDGRWFRSNGWYNTLSWQLLTAQEANSPEKRVSMGFHYTRGYLFNPHFGLGVGTGVDLHEVPFVPFYGEITGYLFKKAKWKIINSNRRIPFSYTVQAGYHAPINKEDDEFENITGGWLVYPSVGILLPMRRGPALKLDFGYKFQKYHRSFESPWWVDYKAEDEVLLKSFAIRGSLVF